MSNHFKIPDEVELEIREQYKSCAYCGKEMIFPWRGDNRRDSATIEHLSEKRPFYWGELYRGRKLSKEGLVICCGSCNSSRGRKKLRKWFKKPYCKNPGGERRRIIDENSVAKSVKEYIRKNE